MKTKLLCLIIFGLSVICFSLGDFSQTMINHETNLAYALSPKPKTPPDHPGRKSASPVPEPSTLALMGGGAAAAGIYIAIRNRNKKK